MPASVCGTQPHGITKRQRARARGYRSIDQPRVFDLSRRRAVPLAPASDRATTGEGTVGTRNRRIIDIGSIPDRLAVRNNDVSLMPPNERERGHSCRSAKVAREEASGPASSSCSFSLSLFRRLSRVYANGVTQQCRIRRNLDASKERSLVCS